MHFLKRREDMARTWFFVGVLLTMATFTFFSIGDHWFGDRFELLEHTLFWFVSLASWVVFTRLKAQAPTDPVSLPKAQRLIAGIAGGVLVLVTAIAIFCHNTSDFPKRTAAIAAEPVGDHIYKVAFPFLGGSSVFENSLALFKEQHPDEAIQHIYTVPNPLRLKKADALIFYIITEDTP